MGLRPPKDYSLQWRHNERDGVSNHQPHDCLLNRLFWHRSKKTPKLRVTGLCARNSPVTGEFPAQRASNAENVSIWWRHHVMLSFSFTTFSNNDIIIWVCIFLHGNTSSISYGTVKILLMQKCLELIWARVRQGLAFNSPQHCVSCHDVFY